MNTNPAVGKPQKETQIMSWDFYKPFRHHRRFLTPAFIADIEKLQGFGAKGQDQVVADKFTTAQLLIPVDSLARAAIMGATLAQLLPGRKYLLPTLEELWMKIADHARNYSRLSIARGVLAGTEFREIFLRHGLDAPTPEDLKGWFDDTPGTNFEAHLEGQIWALKWLPFAERKPRNWRDEEVKIFRDCLKVPISSGNPISETHVYETLRTWAQRNGLMSRTWGAIYDKALELKRGVPFKPDASGHQILEKIRTQQLIETDVRNCIRVTRIMAEGTLKEDTAWETSHAEPPSRPLILLSSPNEGIPTPAVRPQPPTTDDPQNGKPGNGRIANALRTSMEETQELVAKMVQQESFTHKSLSFRNGQIYVCVSPSATVLAKEVPVGSPAVALINQDISGFLDRACALKEEQEAGRVAAAQKAAQKAAQEARKMAAAQEEAQALVTSLGSLLGNLRGKLSE